jgi:hypothetical protein
MDTRRLQELAGIIKPGEQQLLNEEETSSKENLINEAKTKRKKPSSGLSKKKKSSIVKKAEKGEDIGHGNFEKVAAKAAKEYGSKKAGQEVAAASMWKNIKRKK